MEWQWWLIHLYYLIRLKIQAYLCKKYCKQQYPKETLSWFNLNPKGIITFPYDDKQFILRTYTGNNFLLATRVCLQVFQILCVLYHLICQVVTAHLIQVLFYQDKCNNYCHGPLISHWIILYQHYITSLKFLFWAISFLTCL